MEAIPQDITTWDVGADLSRRLFDTDFVYAVRNAIFFRFISLHFDTIATTLRKRKKLNGNFDTLQ